MKFLSFDEPSVIQFSPIRSGSTLVYNYLLHLKKNPQKIHNYNYKKNNRYIITIRHPYNSIISSILRYDKKININTLKEGINEYLSAGGNCIINNNFNDDNHCVLIYEDFLHNHDIILDKLELFFNEKYSMKFKNELKNKLDVNNIKKKLQDKGYDKFEKYDKKYQLHGKHISEFKGNTDYKSILKEHEIKLLENNIKLTKIIDKYYS